MSVDCSNIKSAGVKMSFIDLVVVHVLLYSSFLLIVVVQKASVCTLTLKVHSDQRDYWLWQKGRLISITDEDVIYIATSSYIL